MQRRMSERCALCEEARPLERSHIIPNAFFRRIKPDGKAVQFEPDTPRPNRYVQNSWYERHLCGAREDRISAWERYAIGVIFTPERHGFRRLVSADLTERWSGVDYAGFRLFLLSILFRAAVARGHAFENVVLRPAETARLRSALLEGDLPAPREMGCVPLVPVNPHRQTKLDKMVGRPSCDTAGDRRQYVFAFGGYVWEFYLPKLPLKPYRRGHYLRPEGMMICPAVSMWEHPIVGRALVTSYEKEYQAHGVIGRDKETR